MAKVSLPPITASSYTRTPVSRQMYVRSAGWFALALLGEAAALQLINAGPLLHFQHYRPLVEDQPAALLMVAIQTVCVTIGIGRRWAPIAAWLRATFNWWQLIGVGLVFVFTSAALSRDLLAYAAELPLAVGIQLVNLGNIVLLAWSLPASLVERVGRITENVLADRRILGFDRVALLAAVWVVLVAAALNILAYERHPHIPDEVVYLYPARYMAAGMLTMPAPPVPAAFDVDLMTYEPTRWFSPVQPGWPAVLAIGARVNLAWLVDPVLGGINVLLAFALVRELYDRRTARLAVLLLAVSPWQLFMSMNFMTHTVTLTFALGAAVLVAQARRSGQARWALLAGGLLGCGALVRQLDGLIAAVLLGLWSIGFGGRRLQWSSIAAMVVGTLVVASLWLPFNQALSGDPRVFPLESYIDLHYGKGSNALGFGPDRGQGWALQAFPGHTPLNAAVNTVLNGFSLNIELFGWATGSLVLIAGLVFSGAMRRRDYAMLGAIGVVVGAYSLYWYHGGPDYGPRYWYLILVPCVALAARAVQVLEERISRVAGAAHQARVLGAVAALCGIALLTYVPWRAIDKYHDYELMRADVPQLAESYGFGRSLVLIGGDRHPDYMSAAVYNPLDLQADAPIYAWDKDPAVRREVVQAYADRPIWLVDGPTRTHAGFQVIAGPLSASAVLAQTPTAP